jgi:hypothetical protein
MTSLVNFDMTTCRAALAAAPQTNVSNMAPPTVDVRAC